MFYIVSLRFSINLGLYLFYLVEPRFTFYVHGYCAFYMLKTFVEIIYLKLSSRGCDETNVLRHFCVGYPLWILATWKQKICSTAF
jgi:hypothetical protein